MDAKIEKLIVFQPEHQKTNNVHKALKVPGGLE